MNVISENQFAWLAAAVFFIATAAFVYVSLGIGSLLRPRRPSRDKLRIYECGEPTIGSAWIRYNIRFYTVALVFLVFDVETAFLFPVARVFRFFVSNNFGWLAAVEVLAFVGILLVALIYAWRFGNLDWLRTTDGRADEEDPSQRSLPSAPALSREEIT